MKPSVAPSHSTVTSACPPISVAHIPAELVHGRHDLSCPPDTVWRLARAWRAANLHIVEDSGHTGTPAFAHALRAAVDRLATALRD